MPAKDGSREDENGCRSSPASLSLDFAGEELVEMAAWSLPDRVSHADRSLDLSILI